MAFYGTCFYEIVQISATRQAAHIWSGANWVDEKDREGDLRGLCYSSWYQIRRKQLYIDRIVASACLSISNASF